MLFSFNFAPRGWALCNRQLMAIRQNAALFSAGWQHGRQPAAHESSAVSDSELLYRARGDLPLPELKPANIRLREETPADAEFLYQLYAGTRALEMESVPWDPAQKEAFLRWQFQLQSSHYHEYYPGASYLLIEDGVTPIGRLYVDRAYNPI
jgi:hypothetical protein